MNHPNGTISSDAGFGSKDHRKGVFVFAVMAAAMVGLPVLWGMLCSLGA